MKATFDIAAKLDLYLRKARAGSKLFTFLNTNSTPHDVSAITWQLNIRQNPSTTPVIQLLSGTGLTIATNVITAVISETQSDIPLRLYYWELYDATNKKTWIWGRCQVGNLTPIDSDEVSVTVSTEAENITISVTSGGGITEGEVEDLIAVHTSNTSNPHGVTKSQVGLGNVDNTSDADKPVSTAQAEALSYKLDTDATNLTGENSIYVLTKGDDGYIKWGYLHFTPLLPFSNVLYFDCDRHYETITGGTSTLTYLGGGRNGCSLVLRINTPTAVNFPVIAEMIPGSDNIDTTKMNIITMVFFQDYGGAGDHKILYSIKNMNAL
jgi:hypothetical protein